MIAAGAGIDEIKKYEDGGYPNWFIAKLVAWYRGHIMVKGNTEDAIARKMKSDSKKKR